MEATLEVEDREALAELFYPNGRSGGLTVPGAPPGALGERLTLHVKTRSPGRHFQLLGQIAWVRHKPGPHQPAGFGFDFSPEDEPARQRMLGFARAEIPAKFTRIEDRLQVHLQVRLVHDGLQRKEWLADLSTRGAFVRTWNPLPVGAAVNLLLRPRLSLLSMEIPSHVAWVRLAGDHAGMGLEFSPELATRTKLARLIKSLQS